ncbi:MAG: acyl-CoA thioesterase [Synergistaceae bacterium]|nr:acyl-CoA thioesterase [Synergistaceae bacterium]
MKKNYQLATTIRVRYAETDRMGIVYNSNFLSWFEIARTELCRLWGIPYTQWEKDGLMLPVVESHCRYKHPARYDEQIQLWCRVTDVKIHCITFEYRLLRASDYKLIAEGWTKHGCTNTEGRLYKKQHPFYIWMSSHHLEQQSEKTDS